MNACMYVCIYFLYFYETNTPETSMIDNQKYRRAKYIAVRTDVASRYFYCFKNKVKVMTVFAYYEPAREIGLRTRHGRGALPVWVCLALMYPTVTLR